MAARVSAIVPLVSAARELLRRVAAVIESDLFAAFYAKLDSAEASPADVGFELVNDVVTQLGIFTTTDTARAAISESREAVDYGELVRARDVALRTLYADYKLNGGSGVAGIVKQASDAQVLSRKQTEKLVRELWGIKESGASLVFATYEPDPLPIKSKVPADTVVELAIANTAPFAYDVRALFDAGMINALFPTRTSESIDKRVVKRYQQLITPSTVEFSAGTAPPSEWPTHEVAYRIGERLYRARMPADDLDLVLVRANTHVNAVLQDEILKFYHPSQLENYTRRQRNESKRQYTEAIVGAFNRHKHERRPFLLALGDTFPERDSHTLASLLTFYGQNMRLDREKPDGLRRRLVVPNMTRQLSAIRGGEESVFEEDGSLDLGLLDD